LQRLQQIWACGHAGLTLDDVRTILDRRESDAAAALEKKTIAKEKWISIMKASGLTGETTHRWHAEFEKAAPEEHRFAP
jgi:DNA-binding transcriptional MerR regulator